MPERGDPFPHVRSRIRIGFGQAPEQAGDGAPAEARRGSQLADCNLTARGDESFAYDLVVRPGRVSSRVALLLRGAERKPAPVRFVRGRAFSLPPSPVFGGRCARPFPTSVVGRSWGHAYRSRAPHLPERGRPLRRGSVGKSGSRGVWRGRGEKVVGSVGLEGTTRGWWAGGDE